MTNTVLITGASYGLGYEFAKQFGALQFNLILVARSEDKLRNLQIELQQTYPAITVTVFAVDLTDAKARQTLLSTLTTSYPQIDHVINNAGMGNIGPFHQVDYHQQMALLNLNIIALTDICYALIPNLVKQHCGRILNVASIAAFNPGANMATYFASKIYVSYLSDAINEELKNTGVTVSTPYPGPSVTAFYDAMAKPPLFFNPMMAMPSIKIVAEGIRGMLKGKRAIIPGLRNKLIYIASKLAPKRLAIKITAMMNQGH